MTLKTILLLLWWLAMIWTFTEIFPRPFDDWKNTLLYVGAGIIIITLLAKRVLQVPSPSGGGSGRGGSSSVPPLTPTLSPWERGILFLYFLICTASVAVAPTGKYEGLLELARLILWAGLAWVFAQCSQRTWLWLMRLTVVSAAVIAGLTWLWQQGADIWPYVTPWLAPIGHISYYGDFMALSLVMAVGVLAYAWTSPSPRPSPVGRGGIWIPCMVLIDVGLALSATRASLVGVIAGLLLVLPLVGHATRSIKKVAIIILVGGINLAVIFSLPIKSMRGASAGERLQQSTSISRATVEIVSGGRWHTYVTSAHIAMQRPLLGWGLGTFRFVYPEFAHRNNPDSLVNSAMWYMHPHNEALHQAVEVGLPGALLIFLGFAYLLYGGIRALRHAGPDPASMLSPIWTPAQGRGDESAILLITALCGLTVAFVSWQFSTNFLFPVSRLMTALFVGIIGSSVPHALPLRGRMAEGQERGKHKWTPPHPDPLPRGEGIRYAAIALVTLSTVILLAAYQTSLICVQKEQASPDPRDKWHWAQWAVRLAPGAFDPLFIRAAVALRTQAPPQAAPDVEALYSQYPYVPAVLHMMGYLRAQQGNIPEARKFLQHAVANDPGNDNAKQLLDQLPAEH